MKLLSKSDVQSQTAQNTRRIHHLVKVAEATNNDDDRVRRLRHYECRYCFYASQRIGGAAMTRWNCRICDSEFMCGSTNVPTLCQPCAEKHSLCCQCGADRELRGNRRSFLFDVPDPNAKPSVRGAFNPPSAVLLPKRSKST